MVLRVGNRGGHAQSAAHCIERHHDPALTDLIVVGARPVVDAARTGGYKFDYDAPIGSLTMRHQTSVGSATPNSVSRSL